MREQRPSSAATFLRCLGQPALIESLNLPPTTNDYAVEGSAAHKLGEECLREKLQPQEYLGDKLDVTVKEPDGNGGVREKTVWVEVTQNMVDAVEKYVELIRREAYGNVLLIEHKINCSKILGFQPGTGDPRTGTGDAIIVPKSADKPLQVHDYKHGQGVEVFAEKNFQLMIYAGAFLLSNIKKLPHKKIQLWIHQPRIKYEPDVWEISREDLVEWAAKAKKRSETADRLKAGEGLKPGETQCRWCEAARQNKCPAIHDKVAEAFENIDEATESVIPPEDLDVLSERLDMIPLLQLFINATQAEGYQLLESGHAVPNYKLVAGKRGARRWSNEKKAEERVKRMRLKREDMYNMNLKSPTQLEKVLTENRYAALKDEGLITQSDGKATMVRSDDPREGLTYENQFENLEGN